MRAAVYRAYGPPEVVYVVELPRPQPKEHEVLVKVHSATVNRTDAGFRSAEYVVSRLFSGLLRPKFPVLGCEFSGTVEVIGSQVKRYKVGDHVFGFNDQAFGGHAEYLTMADTDAMAHVPERLSMEEAAAIAEGGHYALCDIRAARVTSGQHVMVYGATGAIGSAAVQLLKAIGAHVTAVCGTRHVELVRSLGADHVIDYQTDDYTRTATRFHFILDAVGKSSFGACRPLLTEKGIYISTEFGRKGENVPLSLLTPLLGGRRVLFPLPTITREDVLYLKDLVDRGAYRPVIDRYYTLEQIVEAYRYVETGQKIGNVILRIARP